MKKIYLALLWHQHQPNYKNPFTNNYELPWVRLHATKDYYDMVAILDNFPNVRVNINLVPSLLEQILDYAQNNATDYYLELSKKDAAELSETERIFILHNFFLANYPTMIEPYPRYNFLLNKRGLNSNLAELKRRHSDFSVAEIRDLQVWFNLTWMDPYWRQTDPLIKELFARGKNFTEEEKKQLLEKQRQICAMIIPKHKEMQQRRQIEISTSAFYHPILPLLIDTNLARMALPTANLPPKFQHPEDARQQIFKGINFYEKLFGQKPAGFWPSEGSVAEELIPFLVEAGIKWLATDEEILFKSLELQKTPVDRKDLYQPYQLKIPGSDESRQPAIIFRDHGLSDAIGFVYSKWSPEDAVQDFLGNIKKIAESFNNNNNEPLLVSVILDGENCWEYYPNDGWDFLTKLYEKLNSDPEIETVLVSEYLNRFPPQKHLRRLFAGSWINGNFAIWIGHQQDNLAWEYLAKTRNFLLDYIDRHKNSISTSQVQQAWEQIYRAEGSDWNWWYGNDHYSAQDSIFDALFRQHLMRVYDLLGEKIPDYLHVAIKQPFYQKTVDLVPVDFLNVSIDGKVTNYYEWLPAGFYRCSQRGSAMHQVTTILDSIYYGFDLNNLYIRLDPHWAAHLEPAISEYTFQITFLHPEKYTAEIRLTTTKKSELILHTPEGELIFLNSVAFKKIFEVAIPFVHLHTIPGEKIEFVVVVLKNGNEIERWPLQSSISFQHPTDDFGSDYWT